MIGIVSFCASTMAASNWERPMALSSARHRSIGSRMPVPDGRCNCSPAACCAVRRVRRLSTGSVCRADAQSTAGYRVVTSHLSNASDMIAVAGSVPNSFHSAGHAHRRGPPARRVTHLQDTAAASARPDRFDRSRSPGRSQPLRIAACAGVRNPAGKQRVLRSREADGAPGHIADDHGPRPAGPLRPNPRWSARADSDSTGHRDSPSVRYGTRIVSFASGSMSG